MSRMSKYLFALSVAVVSALGIAAPVAAIDPPHVVRPHPHFHAHGLQVTGVVRGSPAALAGLERGDRIVEVDGRRMRTPEELHRALHQTGRRAELTVRDVRSGRLVRVPVFTQGGHIGVTVAPVVY